MKNIEKKKRKGNHYKEKDTHLDQEFDSERKFPLYLILIPFVLQLFQLQVLF